MNKDTLLLDYWEIWKGNFTCTYSNKNYSADELRLLSDRLTKRLQLLGMQEGENVALILANTVAFPLCLIATLGLKGNPILLHASTTIEELKKISKTVSVKWLIHDSIPLTSRIDSKDIGIDQYYEINNNITLSICRLDETYYKDSKTIPEKGVILHQTSGTYGNPLMCIRNQEVAIAEAVNYVSSIKQYDKIKIRFTTPLNHAFAYGYGLMSTIITDSTLIVDAAFNPKKVLAAEKENTSDMLAIVPPMIHSLMHLKKANSGYVLPKIVYYAGTRCDDKLMQDFETLFDIRLFSILGSTETGSIANNNVDNQKKAGVGPVLKNVDVQIRHCHKYKDLGSNIGEVFVKSTAMMQRYYSDDVSTRIDYFPTGDIGYFDSEKNIHIVGRIRDVINVGGIKVDPVEVENVLLSYEGIKDAAVYPGQSEAGEEIILAAVSTHNKDIDVAVLNSYCAKRLNYYKIPKQIIVLDTIPRTASGKCLKVKLPGYAKNIVNL
jgi:acyl-CoA synthetase (AMP-forming)/AMP-acid ligase II